MGNEMSALFPDVVACMQIHDIEIKKMTYLYIVNYAKSKPDLVLLAINSFLKVLLALPRYKSYLIGCDGPESPNTSPSHPNYGLHKCRQGY